MNVCPDVSCQCFMIDGTIGWERVICLPSSSAWSAGGDACGAKMTRDDVMIMLRCRSQATEGNGSGDAVLEITREWAGCMRGPRVLMHNAGC